MTDWYTNPQKYSPDIKPKDNIGRVYSLKILDKPEVIFLQDGQRALKLTVEHEGKTRSMLLHADLARKLHNLELSRETLKDAIVQATCIGKQKTRSGHTLYIYKLMYEGREIE